MSLHPTPEHVQVGLSSQSRRVDELVEQAGIGLSGPLSLRRAALRLLTMIRPELADWGIAVLPGDSAGALTLVGGDDAGFEAVVPQAAVKQLGLGRILRTGGTELVHVSLDDDADGSLSELIPHQRLLDEAAALQPADVLGVGLTVQGTTFGALVMIRGRGKAFDVEDVAVAERVATRAATVLDSARLYEERGRVTSVLQSSLRPPSLPRIDGVRLAARYRTTDENLDIGGDFYDVHGEGDDWLLSLGDVCGKGVEAAALTGRTRQSMRTAGYFDRRPEALLGVLNQVLFDERTRQFVTIACAHMRLDPDGRLELDVASAGHPAPIVLRAGGRVEQVDVYGAPVGMMPNVEYRAVTIRLNRDDTMLMFTNGVDEAMGSDGPYGIDRLVALLTAYARADPEVICEAIERNVLEYVDGHPHDDIALLAVTCGD